MTTYYFIRHCEKETDGTWNPHLTSKGRERAKFWAQKLVDKNIDAIYCTPLIRTQETAAPLLKKLGQDFEIYDPSNLYSQYFQQSTQGKTVLVIGHQDTTPAFVNRILKERRYRYIENQEFGNLYRVRIDNHGEINAELQHFPFPAAE